MYLRLENLLESPRLLYYLEIRLSNKIITVLFFKKTKLYFVLEFTFPQNTLRPRFANQRTDTGEFLFTVHACRRAGGDPEASGARA